MFENLFNGMVGSPITGLVNNITPYQTTIEVDDGSKLPDAPNLCTIGYGEDLETIKYEDKNGNTLSDITRGIEGLPRAWDKGTDVARFFTAFDHNKILEKLVFLKEELGRVKLPPEGWISPTLENGWTNYATATWDTVGYFKDAFGIVHIKGMVKGGTLHKRIFILPAGYRPLLRTMMPIVTSNGTAYGVDRLEIFTDGAVMPRTSANNLVSLGYISFRAEH